MAEVSTFHHLFQDIFALLNRMGLMHISAISEIQKSRNRLKKCLYTKSDRLKKRMKRLFKPAKGHTLTM